MSVPEPQPLHFNYEFGSLNPPQHCPTHAAPGADLHLVSKRAEFWCTICSLVHQREYPHCISYPSCVHYRALSADGSFDEPITVDTPESSPEPEDRRYETEDERDSKRICTEQTLVPVERSLLVLTVPILQAIPSVLSAPPSVTPSPELSPSLMAVPLLLSTPVSVTSSPASSPSPILTGLDPAIHDSNGYSLLFQTPVRYNDFGLRQLRQSVSMALCLSRTYSCVNIMSDDRLRAREDARKEGVAAEDAFDHYFNNARPAALSWEELHLLRDQNDFEIREGIPTTTPPGFALLTCHLGVVQMPNYLAALHDSHDRLNPLNWEVVHRLLHEIMSKYPRRTRLVIDSSELPVSTPMLFRVIPYSANYIFGRDDPLTNFWSHIRSEINCVLAIVDRLHRGKPHQIAYRSALDARTSFLESQELPATALFLPTLTSAVHHADIDLDSVNWHPFIRPLERTFLSQARNHFACLPGPGRTINPIITELLHTKFTQQAEASRAFLQGRVKDCGEIDLYEEPVQSDDYNDDDITADYQTDD